MIKINYSMWRDPQKLGEVKLTKVTITCPACKEVIDAVAHDNIVSGYCAKARKYVKMEVNRS